LGAVISFVTRLSRSASARRQLPQRKRSSSDSRRGPMSNDKKTPRTPRKFKNG